MIGYLSGPITGNLNYMQQFDRAASELGFAQARDIIVVSFLNHELEREAARMQLNALEFDEREGEVAEYLETLLPADWYSWDLSQRVDYFQQRDALSPTIEGTMQRTRVSTKEIYCECLGLPWARFTRQDGDRIKTMLLRIGGWKSGSKLEKVPGYGPQRCYHRSTGND